MIVIVAGLAPSSPALLPPAGEGGSFATSVAKNLPLARGRERGLGGEGASRHTHPQTSDQYPIPSRYFPVWSSTKMISV